MRVRAERVGDLRGRSAKTGRSSWVPEMELQGKERRVMDTTHVKIRDVARGSLLQTAGGFVVADTLSATPGSKDGRVPPVPFWWDTDGGRHFANPTDGELFVAIPGFRTQAVGQTRKGVRHVLLNEVPGQGVQGLCPSSRNADLDVWESGTALSSVNCAHCRRMMSLVSQIRQ